MFTETYVFTETCVHRNTKHLFAEVDSAFNKTRKMCAANAIP